MFDYPRLLYTAWLKTMNARVVRSWGFIGTMLVFILVAPASSRGVHMVEEYLFWRFG
jgi:hypothetical protein